MTRFGCYLVAMNGDPDKTEVAAAQQYFTLMTRAAELQMAVAPPDPKPALARPWSIRFRETMQPHVRYVNQHFPGHFTVVSTLVGFLLSLEDEMIRHLLHPQSSDRPDVSVGLCWANERRARGLAPSTGVAPLYLPDQDIDVPLCVYPNNERGPFEDWFYNTYLREKLPSYLGNKPSLKAYGELPPASVADHTCLGWSGHPADLKPRLRRQLAAAGGFFPVGATVPALKDERRPLFDLFS